jgi:hypothetical protein
MRHKPVPPYPEVFAPPSPHPRLLRVVWSVDEAFEYLVSRLTKNTSEAVEEEDDEA